MKDQILVHFYAVFLQRLPVAQKSPSCDCHITLDTGYDSDLFMTHIAEIIHHTL